MTEEDIVEPEWAESPEAPPKKRGVPGWLLFCGGGCLIAMVLMVVGGFLLYGAWEEANDPDLQWPRLAEYIPFDERPEPWHLTYNPLLPGTEDAFILTDLSGGKNAGTVINFSIYKEAQRSSIEGFFEEGFKGGGLPGVMEMENAEHGEVDLQGRLLPIVRFTQSNPIEQADGVQGAFLDFTPEGDPRLFLIQIITPFKDPPVSEEWLEDVFEPFRIGPDR
jgi:hypothetical protein